MNEKGNQSILSWYQAFLPDVPTSSSTFTFPSTLKSISISTYHKWPTIIFTPLSLLIPITLEMEKSQYSSWAELFCRAYEVIDHITPKPAVSSSNSKDKETYVLITPKTW
ncbi:hypothetical protein Tco_0057405, partial [Tanacetum coccineum]